MDLARLLAPPSDSGPEFEAEAATVGAAPAPPPAPPLTSAVVPAPRAAAGRRHRNPLPAQPRPAPPTAVVVAATQAPVKRKRKSRLSAKQIQTFKENQQDQSRLLNLTLDINDLKQQMRDCLVRKSVYETRVLLHQQRLRGAVLRATEHFFYLFRTGHRAWEPHEAAFFAATIDDRLVISTVVSGVDAFFEQWRRYKQLLRLRCFRIDTTRVLVNETDSSVIECKGEFEGRLTLAAVQTLFPHILTDRDLLARVVDCRLVCPTRTLIYFDAAARIVQYDAHADMFEGLRRVLTSNPIDVITLMARARISVEGSMIPDTADDDHVGGDHYYEAGAAAIEYDAAARE